MKNLDNSSTSLFDLTIIAISDFGIFSKSFLIFSSKNTLSSSIVLKVEISPKHALSRDPKDNFLLDLIHFSKADYLVTGDKALLEHNPFKTATILTPINFEKVINQLKRVLTRL